MRDKTLALLFTWPGFVVSISGLASHEFKRSCFNYYKDGHSIYNWDGKIVELINEGQLSEARK